MTVRGLISCVLLTTYPKRAEMMRQAIRSYSAQTYPDRELVVVNDGIALTATAPNVRVVNTWPGQTIGAKRNLGAARSRGEWLAAWDDDDVSFPERLMVLWAFADDHDAVYAKLSRIWVSDKDLRVLGLIKSEAFATCLVRHDAYDHVEGCPDISYAEDAELYARLKIRRMPTVDAPVPLYVHRRHDLNVTNQHGQSLEQNYERVDPRGAEATTQAVRELVSYPYPDLVRPA